MDADTVTPHGAWWSLALLASGCGKNRWLFHAEHPHELVAAAVKNPLLPKIVSWSFLRDLATATLTSISIFIDLTIIFILNHGIASQGPRCPTQLAPKRTWCHYRVEAVQK